jgi:7-cyano-7-deazaguanine synthase
MNDTSFQGVVLLSGGLDSTAALFWAKPRYSSLHAIAFDYGQPNRDAELTAAKGVAEEEGVPYHGVVLADALRPQRPLGLLARVIDPNGEEAFGRTDRMFVPGRNALFAVTAAAHACSWWPNGNLDIIMGACAEDQTGFPDCRPGNLALLTNALRHLMARHLTIRTPWSDRTKSEILYAVKPDARALAAVVRSYSCYRHDGPCGRCGACLKRAVAFDQQGLVDESRSVKMGGGDPHREAG